ncbi:aminodeoxychorismate/anthranilate synthase component II [uncultured Rikenella sp.]|uniref:anthranilate synthase component II n=1 Tax=uncultured Rikenella sp. TaxID=368003 RepID=UPI002633BC3B|nr:aminodeoxychorismate/anthranilate synthase component II [uncultured Rikenella sp.]
MKILVFDNYDSFTYNLVQLLREAGCDDLDIFRNDRITLDEVERYDKILLSPGPGIPSEAGILLPLIERYAPTKSILGVCLGEQAVGEAFGARLLNLPHVYHGIASPITVAEPDPLFDGLPSRFEAGRYHSWIVDRSGFPSDTLKITAVDDEGHIMALAHRTYDVRGVQFHPESVLTPEGKQLIANWLKH